MQRELLEPQTARAKLPVNDEQARTVTALLSTDPVPSCAPRCLLPDRSGYDELVDPAPVGTCASSDASASRVPRATLGVTLGAGAPGQR
jgi:hypothetical protein